MDVTTGEFGCRKCPGRGDLEWLATHSCRHPGKRSRLLSLLWKLTSRGGKGAAK